MENSDIVITHPGAAGSVYQLVLACRKAGYKPRFYTGIYSPNLRQWFTSLPAVLRMIGQKTYAGLPAAWRHQIERQLSRRAFAGIAAEHCQIFPWGEIIYLAAVRLFPRQPALSNRVMGWRNRRFDRKVANILRRASTTSPWGVIVQDTSGLATLKAAKAGGKIAILHQMIGHIAIGKAILTEEAQLQPDWADSLHFDAPPRLIEDCLTEAVMADYVLASSDYVSQTLVKIGVAAERIRLLPYGVDTQKFQPLTPAQYDARLEAVTAGRKKFRILYAGQISQRKGLSYAIEAVRQLDDAAIELVFLGGLVGEGRGLKRQTAALGQNFIHLPNLPHPEIAAIFRTADMLVYPSLHEGSALAIYEGLASGLPVVTTVPSGSVVRDGVEGFIVPIRDAAALATAIRNLHRHPALRRTLSQAARARAEHYSWAQYQASLAGYLHEFKAASPR
ncbi:MAG: glycosyltransferase family 4 protein [Candidatus Symbiobacter sp.]|nr:glycosyltransferase family 4 protein [Candidatus Symbiobacter sp.]